MFKYFKLLGREIQFSVKDSVPQSLRSRVVYKFSCDGCNASYFGKTTRHICVRVRSLIAQLVRALHRYRRGQGSNPGKPDFFGISFRNCISCFNNCEDLLYIYFFIYS